MPLLVCVALDFFLPILDSMKRCRILFRGSCGPRDYAARRISGAKLSFAFVVCVTLTEFPPDNSTYLLTTCRSLFAPIKRLSSKSVLVEAPGTAPGSSLALSLLQHCPIFITHKKTLVNINKTTSKAIFFDKIFLG